MSPQERTEVRLPGTLEQRRGEPPRLSLTRPQDLGDPVDRLPLGRRRRKLEPKR